MAFCAPAPCLYLFGNLVTWECRCVDAIQWCGATLMVTVFCAVSDRVIFGDIFSSLKPPHLQTHTNLCHILLLCFTFILQQEDMSK